MPIVYRIRYKEAEGAAEDETLVEANSPNEALVKFRHSHAAEAASATAAELVTSIYAEYYGEKSTW